MKKEKQFIEEFALYFEQSGFPRMPGRVLGWLLISDPPHQSMNQLVEILHASKSSISISVRHLIEAGYIERVSFPGVRRDFYRMRSDYDIASIERFASRIAGFAKFAERWLSLLGNPSDAHLQKLKMMRDINTFMDQELSKAAQHWEKHSSRKTR
jgi:DNA-binding transcriptional regulator GbsR (MarR family)